MKRVWRFSLLLSLGMGVATFPAIAQPTTSNVAALSTDPLLPMSKAEDARVGPLAMVTILTADITASRRFYQGLMDMEMQTQRVTGSQARALARDYRVPRQNHFNVTIFSRSQLPEAAKVRVIEVTSPLPLARPNHDAQIVGPLSLGFPLHQIEVRAQRLAAAGTPAAAGVTVLSLKRTDGTPYDVKETHFKGPDGVLSLGIDRADMHPVGPIDPALNIGGPAYSGMIVSDIVAMDRFLATVLGFEKRRDVVLASSGPNGGLGLPAGTRFAFQQWFAPGAATGYLVVMDYENAGKPAPHALGGGALGIARLSFSTPNLDIIMARAQENRTPILQAPHAIVEIGIGAVRMAVLATPDGLPIEIFERKATQTIASTPSVVRP